MLIVPSGQPRLPALCRATPEAVAETKNPRLVAFVEQGNIRNGPQVNNGLAPQCCDAAQGSPAQGSAQGIGPTAKFAGAVREGAQEHARENKSLGN